MILHTDQGNEYDARSFRTACERIGIKQSMGKAGSALDNPVIEFELRNVERFATKAAARSPPGSLAGWCCWPLQHVDGHALLMLRHGVAVLQRGSPRSRLDRADPAMLAALTLPRSLMNHQLVDRRPSCAGTAVLSRGAGSIHGGLGQP